MQLIAYAKEHMLADDYSDCVAVGNRQRDGP
jgi:hypothetical protein